MCNGRKFFPKIQKIFVEIEKFFRLEEKGFSTNDNSEAAQWLRAIKVTINEGPVPEEIMQNETFRRLLDSVKLINFAEELFNCEVKNVTDLMAEHEIGFAEGKKEGRDAGLAEGRAEGELKKACEMAAKMLAKNKPIEEIMEFTELSESEILAIKSRVAP
jgi:flagellar biosynthesis/type III secretory pathway protein FliH